jgi:uncharacterized membrane protein YphA (DoxX/SURF4 family)
MSDVAVAIGSAAPARRHVGTVRSSVFWICTVLVAGEMVAGSVWDLLQIEYVRSVFHHLGYPLYLLTIIGACKLPCGLTLLIPRFPRLKEWAYAGAVINYGGAAASHLLVGDGPSIWIGPLVFAVATFGSWALRPEQRRLPQATPSTEVPIIHWIVPVAAVMAFLVFAFLTLPDGPAPYLKTVNPQ